MLWTLMLDCALAILLVATIILALRLNRRLGQLRGDRLDLNALTQKFADATGRAEEAIGRLKRSSEDLQAETTRAAALVDDLRFLIERADAAADRLERNVRLTRGASGGDTVAPPAPASARPTKGRPPATSPAAPRSEAERNLLEALGMKGLSR